MPCHDSRPTQEKGGNAFADASLSAKRSHGDRWSCLYPDLKDFLARLPRLRRACDRFGHRKLTAPLPFDYHRDYADLVASAEGVGELRHMFIEGFNRAKNCLDLLSVYPFAADGAAQDLIVERVIPWDNGFEGQIEASTPDGRPVAFFDTLFFLNQDRYRLGQIYRFSLAALVYGAQEPEVTFLEVPKTEANRHLWAGLDPDLSRPVRIDLAGMSALLPIEAWDIDDYQYQARVMDLKEVDFAGTRVFKARILLDPLSDNLPVDLYIPAVVLQPGFQPRPGMDLTGSFWLQGHLRG